ncbi:MAG: hypothetical protein D6681_10750, partial [Calditrichaeota bacterium]
MSLKVVHLFFICTAILLSLGFGVWSFRQYLAVSQGMYLFLGILSTVVGLVLIYYGMRFWQKMKHLSN